MVVLNPECRDGKHPNCDGRGWDPDTDEACECPCSCHSTKPGPTLADVRDAIIKGLRAKGYDIPDDAPVMFCNVKDGDE